jgi:predicted site-specific integrase-resolvase
MSKLLNQKELAAKLGVAPLTVARMTERGEITPLYVRPRCPRFSYDKVIAELEKNQQNACK